MLFIESPLHQRCCNIKAILYDIDCFVASNAFSELNKIRYKIEPGARERDVKDIMIYKDILLAWANGDKNYDTTFTKIVSNIKRIINK